MTALDAFLGDEQRRLIEIRRSLDVLGALRDDLELVTRGKPFRVRSEPAWMMVVAAFDVAIIDLASYATPPRAVGGPLEENVPDLVDQIRGPWCRRHG